MESTFFEEFSLMDTKHASMQPQDPVAARLGMYISRAGIAVALILFVVSYLRG
ncbi:hypothetical protein [Variovorax sp. JS1663]|uniref:hypothetical protein n=1 Tax=Variovorax sp. JS1663 TaxID=1851577 RepID=UPI00130244BD|nr:hypothetical protein [Variovorax sp. JS1663]